MSKELIEDICKSIIKHGIINNKSIDISELINKTTTFVNNIYGEVEFINLQQKILDHEFTRWMP